MARGVAVSLITTCAITIAVVVSPLAVFAKNPQMILRKSGGMSLAPAALPLIRQGDYWRKHGELEKALEFYSQAIKIDPKASNAYIGRAQVWEEFGKVDKALADLNTAFKNDPPFNRTAARLRGDLYQSLHRYQDAINDYSLLLTGHGTDGLYSSRGNCYLKINKRDLALKDFTKSLSIGGVRSSTLERRADVYLSLNQNAKALADYNMALKLDPEGNNSKDNHEHLHKSKAEIFKRMGKLDLAKKEITAASEGRNATLDMAPFMTDSLK